MVGVAPVPYGISSEQPLLPGYFTQEQFLDHFHNHILSILHISWWRRIVSVLPAALIEFREEEQSCIFIGNYAGFMSRREDWAARRI